MDEEEYNEPPPPEALTVAKRVLILATVSCRGATDQEENDPSGAGKLAKNSFDWLRALGLDDELSKWEQDLLSTEFGCLAARDAINASWLAEGMVVLAWALGQVEMPAFDTRCDPAETANALGFLKASSENVLSRPRLRRHEELLEYNEFIYNVHWRLRDFLLNHRFYDFESLARKAWEEPLLRFGLKLTEKDIEVAGVPLFRASERDLQTLYSITSERHRASNWLIGYVSTDFYEVTTDT